MLMNLPSSTELIRCHAGSTNFNYDVAVDWAVELLSNNIETEAILILGAFAKPVDAFEIRNYVNDALKELGLEPYSGEHAIMAEIQYLLNQILNNVKIRDCLKRLYDLANETDYKYGLMPFYMIYHGWTELEDMGVNYYCKGQTPNDLELELREEASNWVQHQHNGEIKST